jgi:hypothetical protein
VTKESHNIAWIPEARGKCKLFNTMAVLFLLNPYFAYTLLNTYPCRFPVYGCMGGISGKMRSFMGLYFTSQEQAFLL